MTREQQIDEAVRRVTTMEEREILELYLGPKYDGLLDARELVTHPSLQSIRAEYRHIGEEGA